MSRKRKVRHYFVWDREYPDEGSILIQARTKRSALKRGAKMLSEKQVNVVCVLAKPGEALRWQESGQ